MGFAGGGRPPVDFQVASLEDLVYSVVSQGLLKVPLDQSLLFDLAEAGSGGTTAHDKVWSLTQFYSVDFVQLRIAGVKKMFAFLTHKQRLCLL